MSEGQAKRETMPIEEATVSNMWEIAAKPHRDGQVYRLEEFHAS
jgi:hypothetical protein